MGEIKVTWDVKDQNQKTYGLTFFTLDRDKDLIDLMAATARPVPPDWSNLMMYQEQGPNTSQTYSLKADQGPVYIVCWSKPPDITIGNVGPFEVQP